MTSPLDTDTSPVSAVKSLASSLLLFSALARTLFETSYYVQIFAHNFILSTLCGIAQYLNITSRLLH